MTFETKKQILEKILAQEKPKCPHCNEEMKLWEVPPIPVGDGLGWGVPYLYICFNDECPPYKNGWENMLDNYAQNASYRCMCYPGTDTYEAIPVFSRMGAKGQVIDDEVLAQEAALKESIKQGFSILAGCYNDKDWLLALKLLLDATQPAKVRLKAAEMLGDIGTTEVIDSMENTKFGNEIIAKQVEDSITAIHKRYFTRECPFCAEIIKQKAKICKHCKKEVAGK